MAILGSTGSIGTSALRVLDRHREEFDLVAIVAGSNRDALRAQVARWNPRFAGLACGPLDATFAAGPESLIEAATHPDVDIVLNAVVGAAGLDATLAALHAGKRVALANKESLVMAGALVAMAAQQGGGELVPIDSEHSAVLQCITDQAVRPSRLILTASGGPFRTWPDDRIQAATVGEALNHPTWNMGAKVTVDSATLANKALEVIEAHFLFGLGYDALEVVVHPQSIVHALVEFQDGSVLAQMGYPSMEGPILYALTHPHRVADLGGRRFDPVAVGSLTFESIRHDSFPAFDLGVAAGRAGGTAPDRIQRRQRGGGEGVPRSTDPVRPHQRRHRSGPLPPCTRSSRFRRGRAGCRHRRAAAGRGGDRMSNFLFTVAILAIVLGVLVFVHELGHFLAAKMFGVWVHRFAIGIGKPIPWLKFHSGETEWAVAWLPLGGYVKMASREEDPASSVLEGHSAADVPPGRVFEAKPTWQRMVIILAGVTLNALFAWMIFTGLAWKNGRHFNPTTTIGHVNARRLPPEAAALAALPDGTRIVSINGHPVHAWDDVIEQITASSENSIDLTFADHAPVSIPLHRDALLERAQLATEALEPLQSAVIGSLAVGYPAARAGLAVGDSIVAVDSIPVAMWSDAVEQIKGAAGRQIALTVLRKGSPLTVELTPRAEREVPGDTTSAMVGRIGLTARSDYQVEPLGFVGGLTAGFQATVDAAGTIFRTIRGLFSRNVSIDNVGGPILIGQMAAQQARAGLDNLLAFMAIISINLAVVNLLPIPVLDGGAFLILLVEGIIRRSLPSRLREAVSLVGLALVVLLMVVAFKNDIMRLLSP